MSKLQEAHRKQGATVSQPPLVLDLPKSDPLHGLDLRAVIEYHGRTCRHLHDLLDQRSKEIYRLKKELARKIADIA